MSTLEQTTIAVQVVATRWEAESIASYEFAALDGSDLPEWAAGAHIDVHLPSGLTRQYSLCGDPSERSRYRIAVLEIIDGRGGSAEVHRELRAGRTLQIGLPRNNFTLADAERYVFVAGGIGITPLLPMIRQADRAGTPWELVYGARSAGHFAFGDELARLGASVRLLAQDVDGHPDFAALTQDSTGAAVYCCGPSGLMDALTEHMDRAGRLTDLNLERFAAAPVGETAPGDGFQVELARTGTVVDVGPDETVLDAVRAAGVDHPSSCEMGFCGTCETKVLAGEVDHRDDLLTDDERAQGNCMMICVSRAKCSRLVLDL
ncbi:MAG TPA: PDR/VanB family oxidoreductase [Aldersonia sp.]